MARRAYRNVARITKTQGLSGEVVVVPVDGLPFLLSEGTEVFFTPPQLRGPRWGKVEQVRPVSKGYCVRFDSITDSKAAQALVGSTCLVDAEVLSAAGITAGIGVTGAAPGTFFFDEPDQDLGAILKDEEHGVIGTVVEVLETKAGYMWVAQGAYGEVLIPIVEEFVLEAYEEENDEGAVRLVYELQLPAGLVELNAPATNKDTSC